MYLAQRKRYILKVLSALVCFVFISAQISPQEAFARRSGQELAEFNFGRVAMSVGIALGSMAVGSALNAGISSLGSGFSSGLGSGLLPATGGNLDGALELMNLSESASSVANTGVFSNVLSSMGDAFTKSFSWPNMVTNYSTFVATSEVGAAVGAAGRYYGWDPSTTFLISNIATGATGGFLNPSVALANSVSDSTLATMARGAVVGALTGAASAGVIVAIDGGRMDNKNLPQDERRPGVGAQIASMFAGVMVGNLARALVNPDTYNIAQNPEIVRQQNLAMKAETVADALVYSQSAEQLQQGGFYIIPQRLLEAAFIKTADMWPQLAARSLSILAANSVSDKDERGRNKNDFLSSSLVSSLVQGVATPLFTGAAYYFDLQPGLYIGENNEKRYNAHLAQINQEIQNQNRGKNITDPGIQGPIEDSSAVRLSLFLNMASKETLFGFAEGAIHGGVSYLISGRSKNDSLAAAAASYGATLVSGAIRGAVQYATYDQDAQKDLQNRQDGLEQRVQQKEITQETANEYRKAYSEYDSATRRLDAAILTSMAKANRDFLDRALAFGTPRGDPKTIDALAMVDYFNKLNSYGAAARTPGWFANALTSGFIQAGSSAASVDILTALGATPIGGYFNIAPYTYETKSASRGETYRTRGQQ